MTDLTINGGGASASTPARPLQLYLRQHGSRLAVEVVVNFALPYVIFSRLKPGLGDAGALMASSAAPILWSLVQLVRRRRADAISLMVLAGIGLSLLAFLGGGSVHLLQLREKLVSVLIGVAFLGSAAIGRPLAYQFARAGLARGNPSELGAFEGLRDDPHFRRGMTRATLVWGFTLVGEAALCCLLVFTLSTQDYLIVSHLLGYATMGGLGLWTFWFSRHNRRERLARQAAGAAA
jgi:hypothetical protein